MEHPDTTHRACPQCGNSSAAGQRLSYGAPDWLMQQCECGFVYLQNALTYDSLTDSHSWSRTFSQERRNRERREPIFNTLSRAFKSLRVRYFRRDKALAYSTQQVTGNNFLDIGCGYGELLQRLPSRFVPFGIEIDAAAAANANQYARQRGGQVWQVDALSGLRSLDSGTFDGILMHSYLEHEILPFEVLTEARRVLRPGGRVIVKVPNYACWNRLVRQSRWCGFRFPDHVNYFTPTSLATMVRRAGLAIASFRLRHRPPSSDNMWLIAERSRLPAGGAERRAA